MYFSEGTQSEKYFSDGIRIFLCVFAHTEKCEFPVVNQKNASTESLQNNNLEGRRNVVVHDSTGSSGVAS